MINTKNVLLSLAVATLLSACSMKKETDKKFDEQSANMINRYDEGNTLLKDVKDREIINKMSYVNVDTKKTVDALLKNLSQIDGRFYHLEGMDMIIPSVRNYNKINDFQSLNNYIQSTTNKALVIESNKYLANGIKSVRLIDKNSIKNNFDEVKINLQGGNYNLENALLEVASLTGFNIVYKNTSSDESSIDGMNTTNNPKTIFNAEVISFQQGSLSQFLKVIEKSLDIYVDVDYKEKMLIISKYKSRNIPLVINDRDIEKKRIASSAGGADSLEVDMGEDVGGLSSQFKFGIFKELQKSLDELTKNYGNKNKATVDIGTGSVNIYATNEVMKQIIDKLEAYNDSFRKSVEIELTTMELIVNNSYDFGIDTVGSATDSSNGVIGAIQTALMGENLPSISVTSKNGSKATLKSFKDIGYIAKTSTDTYKTRNHIPFTIQRSDVTNYVENMTTTPVQTGDTTTLTQSTQTSKIEVGLTAVVLPKIVGDEISVYINPASTRLNSMEKEKYSDLEINIPSINISVIEAEPIMRSGDKIIIGSHTTYEDADSYKGLLPLDKVAIGGANSKKLVKKVVVYILSAKTY